MEGDDLVEALNAGEVTHGSLLVGDAPSNQAFGRFHHLEHVSERV